MIRFPLGLATSRRQGPNGLGSSKPRVEIRLKGQNGLDSVTKPKIGLPCGKGKSRG